MSAGPVFPDDVRSTTATAKTVYATLLLADDALTVSALVDETGQCRRAVERSLNTLADNGAVFSRPDPSDPRRDLWSVA